MSERIINLILLVFGFRFFGKYQAQKSLEYADNKRRAGELEEAKNIQFQC